MENKKAVLGFFEGECADANITNLNGLDITREVWENVFDSEEYKKGIELGHYIGFLGHPEDPSCQEFEKACIVMTEGWIDDNGKVYGKFNLVDTPVGRIVKSFQDAGVIFGISVRGAGDIVNNSVDPDTFVFRGFDLVAFPAYPESIPEFIAASKDSEKQKKYKAVCASIDANAEYLDDVDTIDILQSKLAKQSDAYKKLEDRKKEISECDSTDEEDFQYEQIRGMYDLYENEKRRNDILSSELKRTKQLLNQSIRDNNRRIKSIERIMTSQMYDLRSQLITANDKIKRNQKILANKESSARKIEDDYDLLYDNYESVRRRYDKLQSKYDSCESKMKDINDTNEELSDKILSLEEEVKECKSENLIYKKEIESSQLDSDNKDNIIASLEEKLNETVRQLDESKVNASNRDEKIDVIKSELDETNSLLQEYQEAYANLYANAVGVYLPNVSISATASVKDIQDIILGNSDIERQNRKVKPTDLSVESFDSFSDDGLVTI